MKKGKNIVNRVDAAFSEALEMIGIKKGRPKKNVCLRVRFIGEQKAMELGLFTPKSITQIHHSELFSPKLTAMRFGLDDFYCSLRAFYQMTKKQFNVSSKEDIALLLYESPRQQKPIIVTAINGKIKHSICVSDLLAILGIGDELLN